ncbi:hypothetical protein LEMLEM_LOCUS12323 [Lemmus lemmus]
MLSNPGQRDPSLSPIAEVLVLQPPTATTDAHLIAEPWGQERTTVSQNQTLFSSAACTSALPLLKRPEVTLAPSPKKEILNSVCLLESDLPVCSPYPSPLSPRKPSRYLAGSDLLT